MKKILLPIVALFFFSGLAYAEKTPEIEETGLHGEHDAIEKPEEHEAHHFCEHVAPEYGLNLIDLFDYKQNNEKEIEKCIETVEEHGVLVMPGGMAHDGNPVSKTEVDAGIIDKESPKYKPEIHRPHIVGPPYLAAIINFLLLVWILVRNAKKPLQDFLNSRYDSIKTELEASTKRFDAAKARLAEYEERLRNMEDEKKKLIQSYETQAQRDVDELKKDLGRHLDKIKKDAERDVENAILIAEKSIRREAVEAAISMAENVLTKELTQEDRQRLTDQFITRVNTHKNQRGNA
jgi:F-type H+-transporting ATPase subunit b